MSKKLKLELIPLILVPVIYLISRLIEKSSQSFEVIYANGINKWVIERLSLFTGIFNFSIGEFVIYANVLSVPVVVTILCIKLFKGGLLKSLFRLLQYVSVLYILFMVLWGFNYQRQSISKLMDFEVEKYSTEQLSTITKSLIEDANALRDLQVEDAQGVMMSVGGYKEIFNEAHKGYEEIGKTVKILSGTYGKPKAVFASQRMLYTGITGVYFPFTAEANVNVATLDLLLPATTLHEMAHQRGIAFEDEANFVAYITSQAHPSNNFKYSGTVLALIHAMNALYSADPEVASALRQTYSEGLNRDIVNYSIFWKTYEGKTNEVADRVNDTYLKSNGQKDGVKSYGRMVDLLLGYYYR